MNYGVKIKGYVKTCRAYGNKWNIYLQKLCMANALLFPCVSFNVQIKTLMILSLIALILRNNCRVIMLYVSCDFT